MDEKEPEKIRDSERTTIIHTDGDRGGGGGVLLAVVALIVLAVLLFFLFGGGNFGRTADEGDVNVNIGAPIEVPDVNVELPAIEEPAGNTTTNNAQ